MEIIDLGQDTYLVGRRVIKSGVSGMFDISKQSDRDELIRLANGLYKTKFDPACYGDLTVCVLYPLKPDHGLPTKTAKYLNGQMHFGHLHDVAKEILRREFPEYADKI